MPAPDTAAGLPLIDDETQKPPAPSPGRGRFLLGISLVLMALNLRMVVTSLGPELNEASLAAGLSIAAKSLLATLPSLAFGVMAFPAPALGRRLGVERALLLALATLACGAALRWTGTAWGLLGGQALGCCGIGVINVLLPGLVKRDFPDKVALMTGLYTTALCVGAGLAAGITVPVRNALGGDWPAALGLWAVPALLAAGLWARQVPRRHTPAPAVPAAFSLWRDGLAWQVTLFMGLQSALAYIVFGWLAPIMRDRGFSPQEAGLVLSVSVLAQVPAALLAPGLATRGRDQRLANAGCMGLCIVGMLGCLFAPVATVWLWAVLLGIAQGALIALALTIIVLRAPDTHVAARLSGMAQGVGYLLASAGPFLAGLVHGWTGSWAPLGGLTVAVGLAAVWAGIGAGRPVFVGGGAGAGG